jgi:DNA processing protein
LRGSTEEDELLAALTLALAPQIPLREKAKLVENWKSCYRALAHLPAGTTAETKKRAEKDLKESLRRGYSVISLTSPDYPTLLKEIADPPLALYVWGSLQSDDAVSLAVVGSRRATPYGIEMCARLSRELAERGATIVSGLARGIDAAAHQAALEAGGRTLAVLGSGLDFIYPKEHKFLAERIAETAAILSEFPLGSPPLPGHFPRRNRIVSGLALGTIVVEAAERSGSLISARLAAEENREVFAVPGPVSSPNSRGVHRLIQSGAKLVTDANDVIEELRPDVRQMLQPANRKRAEADPSSVTTDSLERDETAVLEAVARQGTVDAEHLTAVLGLPADRVAAALVGLEIKGRLRSFGGGYYRVRATSKRSS